MNVMSYLTDQIGGWSEVSIWRYTPIPLHCVAVFFSWIVYVVGMDWWIFQKSTIQPMIPGLSGAAPRSTTPAKRIKSQPGSDRARVDPVKPPRRTQQSKREAWTGIGEPLRLSRKSFSAKRLFANSGDDTIAAYLATCERVRVTDIAHHVLGIEGSEKSGAILAGSD